MNIYELDNYSDLQVADYVYDALIRQGRGGYKLVGVGYPRRYAQLEGK